MRNVSDKICRENQNTHLVVDNLFFCPKRRAVYEVMWKNMEESERLQATTRRMSNAR
jgi:hypothetical protein